MFEFLNLEDEIGDLLVSHPVGDLGDVTFEDGNNVYSFVSQCMCKFDPFHYCYFILNYFRPEFLFVITTGFYSI